MANIVKVKRSATPAKVPTTSDLQLGEIAVNTYDGKMYIKKNDGTDAIVQIGGTAGSGDVVGPASATDNAIARFDSTTGKLIQNSAVTVSDTGALAGVLSITDPNFIDFNTGYTTPVTAGQLGWDGTFNSLALGMIGGNVIQHVGEDTYIYVKASSAITRGQVVMFTGSVGASGVATAAPSTGVTNGQTIIGVAAESIALNGFGLIQTYGELRSVNTSAFADGDILYYNSAVTGGFTTTYPSSGPIVTVAAVLNGGSAGGGVITVRVSVTQRLTASTGISVSQAATGSTITNTGVTSITGTASQITASASTGGVTLSLPATINVNTSGSAATLTTGRTIAITGDLTYTSPSFNGSGNVTAAGTLATVNANVGSFTNASITVNAKGLVTAASSGTAPVTSVTGTSPVVSSGGATPAISMPAATTSVNGYLTSTDWNTFNSKTSNTGTVTSVTATAGTGISITGSPITTSGTLTITNTAPDQVVALTGAGGISVSGTYPSFTITGTTYSSATSTVAGLIELGDNTVQTVASNAVSATASRTYALQVNAAGQGVINVPWTDTNSGGTVTSVAALTLGTTGTDLSSSVANGTTTPVITLNVPTASATNRGALSAADWTTFNNKTSNTGTVTSVGGTGTVSGLSLSGTVTTSGNLTLGGTLAVLPSNFASQTANTILAAPNGTAGVPTFRAIVAADIPTLNQNTTGTASNVTGTVAIANGGTGQTTAANALTALGAYPATNPSGYTTNTGTVTSVAAGTGLSGGTITTTGTIALANTAVTAGSYTNTNITVDAQGRITAASNGSGGSGTVTSVGGTGTVVGLTLTGTVTTSGNLTLGGTFALPTGQVTTRMLYQSFTATASQTTFTPTTAYTASKIQVFANGVMMVNGSDVTVTSGTNVVFASGLPVNTRVDVVYPT